LLFVLVVVAKEEEEEDWRKKKHISSCIFGEEENQSSSRLLGFPSDVQKKNKKKMMTMRESFASFFETVTTGAHAVANAATTAATTGAHAAANVVRKTTSARLFTLSGQGKKIEEEIDDVKELIGLLKENLAREFRNTHSRDEKYVWKLVNTIKDLQTLLEFRESPGENTDAINRVWEAVLKNAHRVKKVDDYGVVTCFKNPHIFETDAARDKVQSMAKNRFVACTLRITDTNEQNRVIQSREELVADMAKKELDILFAHLREENVLESQRVVKSGKGKKKSRRGVGNVGADDDEEELMELMEEKGERGGGGADVFADAQMELDNEPPPSARRKSLLGIVSAMRKRRRGEEEEEEEEDEEEEEEEEEEENQKEKYVEEDTADIEEYVGNSWKIIRSIKRKQQSGIVTAMFALSMMMRAFLARIEPNSTSGMLVGCVGSILWLTYAGHSMTWFLCSNKTAKRPSEAYRDMLSLQDRQKMDRMSSEMEKVKFLKQKIDEMSEPVRRQKFVDIMKQPDHCVRLVGKRVRKVLGHGEIETSSENPFMSKIVNFMFGFDRSVLIDNAGAGAFKDETGKDSILGTFVVRAFDKISKMMERARIRLIVLNDTFHFWLSEGAWGGTCYLQEFLNEGWTVLKIHPDAFTDIEYKNRKGKFETARNMLLRFSFWPERYMKSWRGYYCCYRKIKGSNDEYEVRWLLNIVSLCRFGHLRLWLLNDYRELLAMINVFRFLCGKHMWDYSQNPLTWADDKRSDGKFLIRPFLGPKVHYEMSPSVDAMHPLADEIRQIFKGRLP